MEADAGRPNGRAQAWIETALSNLGAILESDPAARARVERAAEAMVQGLLPAAREQLAGFIAQAVAGWDTATITERLELRVGKDLQYVRINGTVVGFVVGGALHALFWMIS